MQTNNRLFDDLAKVITGAAGAAQGVRSEVDTMVRAQIERLIGDMDVVSRDEFEAVKAMAVKAREENMRLEARLQAFEARLLALGEGQDGPRDVPETSGFVREAH